MMKTESSQHNTGSGITFFEPLKEENPISNSSLLKSLFDLFNTKKSSEDAVSSRSKFYVFKVQQIVPD